MGRGSNQKGPNVELNKNSQFINIYFLAANVDLNVHMNLFQGDSDQRFVTRIWLDYEKQNECE